MLKEIDINRLVCTLAFTLIVINLQAQQNNKPQTTPVVIPGANLPAAYGSNVNYVRTWEPNGPITDANAIISADFKDVLQTTDYSDGLGRTVQTVSRRITPANKDVVVPVTYDQFGRESYTYIPYASPGIDGSYRTNPFVEQQTFMQGQYNDENVYYSQTDYEPSPLNRVRKAMAPGNAWAGSGRGVAFEYMINTAPDAVRIWNINMDDLLYNRNTKDANINIPYNPAAPASQLYNAGELTKNIVKDESGNATVEYMDKDGKVLLKKVQTGSIPADYSGYTGFLCTYYVYDDLNRLRFVMTPKAVAQLIANSWQFTDDIINELCFRYEYDDRGRMAAKKMPGADWVYMVYDVRDRLVFTQDGNLRNKGQWLTTLYDVLNRPVMTGIITGYTADPKALQDLVTSQKTMITTPPPGMVADLVLPNTTQASPFNGTYQAYSSITLVTGFESATNQDFTAEIYNAGGNDIPEESIVDGISINKNPIPSVATFIALTKTYYDSYNSNWTNRSFTNSYNSRLDAGTNRHPVAPPSTNNTQTAGLVTGSSVRVVTDAANLAAGNWLTTVNFYDDHNRIIQTNSETLKGVNITTNQYDFSGNIICTYLDHTNSAGTPASVRVKTSIEYDHADRMLEVWKTLDDDPAKKTLIVKYEYDEVGQAKNKQVGHKKVVNGGYTTAKYDPLETLHYSFNIRGWMTGINKDYVNKAGLPDAWFGLELNYDKGFQLPQYNGNVAGTKWRSKGDGEQRAYGFTYDKANRILGADFSQFDGSAYVDHPTIQFDMEMGNSARALPAYDENGNIRSMKHKGMKLGNSTVIDELEYDYHRGGNKLKSVKDWAPDATGTVGGSWGLGDFTDANSGDDYGYDHNGNMVVDRNKKMTGTPDIDQLNGAISYNYLNLPFKIQSDGGSKGTITYIYDAAGNKLSKSVEDKTVAGKIITTTTSYVGGLIYESRTTSPADPKDYTDRLQLIGHEEGRIRYIPADGNVAARYEYDYFVKDHLGNVRMVLTEENRSHNYMATMEGGKNSEIRKTENQLFDNLDASEFAAASVPNGGYPTGNSATNPNNFVAMVNGTTNKKGPAIVLKVMAGDVVNFGVKYFYQQENNPGGNSSVLTDILSSLAGGIVNASGVAKGSLSDLNNSVSSPLVGALNAFRNDNNPDNSGKPKAYLNWIFVDEQFKYVSTQSGALPVAAANTVGTLYQPDINIAKSGYLFVYVSNETEFWNVYFDDLAIAHHPGALMEETHYYPFGLTMTGISSKAVGFGGPENKFKFNDGTELSEKEFSDGSGLDWYETTFRGYDPQLGRFHQIDPLVELAEDHSPYSFAANNPYLYNDPLGLDTLKRTASGALPETRPDGSALQESDVILGKDGGVSDFYNGENWDQPSTLGQVSVTGKKKGSATTAGGAVTPWMVGVLDDARLMGGAVESKNPTYGIADNALKYTGLSDPVKWAWCSAYACFKLNKSGYKQPKSAASRDWTTSKKVVKTGVYYGAIAVFRNYEDKQLKNKKSTGHIGFLYGVTAGGKYIILGGNQGNALKFSEFSTTSDYIKCIDGYMHLEGFYFPADYNGPMQAAPVLQSAAAMNKQFGIISGKSNSTR